MTIYKAPPKVGFSYCGNKRTYYQFVANAVQASGKKSYFEPFAGSCQTGLAIYRDFPEMDIKLNCFDKQLETILSYSPDEVMQVHDSLIKDITGLNDLEWSSKKVATNDNATWERWKQKAYSLKNNNSGNELQKAVYEFFCTCDGIALKDVFQSPLNRRNREKYIRFFAKRKPSHLAVSQFHQFNPSNAFINIDPPYIQSVKKEKAGKRGENYQSKNKGVKYEEKDNVELIRCVERWIDNGDNVLMVWMAPQSDLELRLNQHADLAKRLKGVHKFEKKVNIIGKVIEKVEICHMYE